MTTCRIKLQFQSGTLTPFHADTIFGHLCWLVVYQDGETGLQEFLRPFQEGNPPFVISDGFPEEFLPKPLSADFITSDIEKATELKRTEWLTQTQFESICAGKSFELDNKAKGRLPFPVISTHNTIDRISQKTLSAGGVYNLEEVPYPEITIYLKSTSKKWNARVTGLMELLSQVGFGKKKSTGKGQFTLKSIEDFNFPPVEGANGFVTLSNFCPAKNDPVEGLYRIFVKYGKLGEEFTFCGNPFKKPLVMIRTGSVFSTGEPPKEFYGRTVAKISPAKENEVIQYAYAFAVPVKYPVK